MVVCAACIYKLCTLNNLSQKKDVALSDSTRNSSGIRGLRAGSMTQSQLISRRNGAGAGFCCCCFGFVCCCLRRGRRED